MKCRDDFPFSFVQAVNGEDGWEPTSAMLLRGSVLWEFAALPPDSVVCQSPSVLISAMPQCPETQRGREEE